MEEAIETFRNVVEAMKMLNLRGRILRMSPPAMAYDIKVDGGGETTYIDFLIEMRMRGYQLKNTVTISHERFWTVVVKCQ